MDIYTLGTGVLTEAPTRRRGCSCLERQVWREVTWCTREVGVHSVDRQWRDSLRAGVGRGAGGPTAVLQ